MKELKSKIEAILYCMPKGIETRKLAKLCGIGSAGHVKITIKALAKDYEARESGLEIIHEGDKWKLAVTPQHAELVRTAAKPELSPAITETLAFIAWKGSPKQSDIIKTRSNKAYDHLVELEERGFISKKKFQNTFRISPTKKFYEYFNLEQGEKLAIEEES